jgi:hypothetical protein
LMRSPTVSVPVDVYVVAFSPALTVIVPPGRMPRLDSDEPVVSSTVPFPVAGEPEELEVLEEPGPGDEEDPAEPFDDGDVELPDSTC